MARGGRREGSGRKPGSKNRKTAELARKAAKAGMTPLELMLKIMRDSKKPILDRFEAAKAAAPYIHPRLAAVEMSGELNISHEAALDELK